MSTTPESFPPVQDPVEAQEQEAMEIPESAELRESDEPQQPDGQDAVKGGPDAPRGDGDAQRGGADVQQGEEGKESDGEDDEDLVDDDGGDPMDDDEADAHAARPDRRHDARTEDLVREGEVAADFLEALLDIADLSGDLEVDIERDRAAVAIVDSEDGPAPRRLVGPGGSVLDALQELTRLAVQADTGERSRLMLDVAGYRADRRAALVRAAHEAIAEVRQSGAPRELEPMTAFERKVVHDEVLAAGLHSESEGAEPSRYVVIKPSA